MVRTTRRRTAADSSQQSSADTSQEDAADADVSHEDTVASPEPETAVDAAAVAAEEAETTVTPADAETTTSEQSDVSQTSQAQTVVGEEANSTGYQRQAQLLLDKLQSKRQQDAQMIDDYRRKLDQRIETQVTRLQNQVYEMHSQRNLSVQPILHELQSTLTRCRGLENDISQFKERLSKFHSIINCAQ